MLFSTWIQIRSLNRRTRSARRLTPSRPNAPRGSKRDVPTDIFPPSVVERIIGAQTYPADIVGTTLILRYGLRRGGVANAQRRDFDFERRQLIVHTKGGRIYPIPLPEEALWLALGRLDLEAQCATRTGSSTGRTRAA